MSPTFPGAPAWPVLRVAGGWGGSGKPGHQVKTGWPEKAKEVTVGSGQAGSGRRGGREEPVCTGPSLEKQHPVFTSPPPIGFPLGDPRELGATKEPPLWSADHSLPEIPSLSLLPFPHSL